MYKIHMPEESKVRLWPLTLFWMC